MVEAKLIEKDGGLAPEGAGWFVVNAARAPWYGSAQFGSAVMFENRAAARFEQVGVNIHALWPGQPNCHYHSEGLQEDFLVLSGECLLIVEEQERRLAAWDFVHCPPGTRHVFVGAGDGPCFILMLGARGPDEGLDYPVSPLALRYGAGVKVQTNDPRVSYADVQRSGPIAAPPLPKLTP
ncbi:MAG: cupin domain-containing protein [Acidobacteriota bacterium]